MTKYQKSFPFFKDISKLIPAVSIFLAGMIFDIGIREIPQINSYLHILKDSNSKENFPKNTIELQRGCYFLGYDFKTRNPLWVYEKLTSDSLKGNIDRSNFQFKEDKSIPEIFRTTLEDYRKTGFDRGHLAPAANHKSNPESMGDTFYLSNMCPQVPQFNRGYWAKLEKHVRDLTKTFQTVEVFSGPLYVPKEKSNGTRWVQYQVIGKNDVAVPSHFYKVIILKSNEKKEILAYILPNNAIDANTPLENFKTTQQKVEKIAGIIF